MKLTILNKEGRKISERETKLFEEPIRADIIGKVIEAEKVWQPWSPRFRAGMDRSASGKVTHRRKVWQSDRGKGLSRVPKKAFWRRGTQFSWEGAIIPSTRGGRRAHPPKGSVNDKKINKKELKKALLSTLSYVGNADEVKKKYKSLSDKKIDVKLPLVVENKVLNLKTKEFAEVLEKILGEFYSVATQKKSIRAGKGKMRGRKYKKNAGLLLVIGKNEDVKIKGVEVVKVPYLIVGDLASNGARLCLFSEGAVEELERVLIGEKKVEGKSEKVKEDKRKLKKEKKKKSEFKQNKGNKNIINAKQNKTRGQKSKRGVSSNLEDNKNNGVKENA